MKPPRSLQRAASSRTLTRPVKATPPVCRLVVALAVGFALLVGVIRILKGWPVQYLIIGGYIGVVLMTAIRPEGNHRYRL